MPLYSIEMVSPSIYDAPLPPLPIEDEINDKASTALSSSSNSSSSLSTSLDNASAITNTSSSTIQPNPIRSLSATTLTMRPPPSGGGSQTKRHSVRSNSGSSTSRQASSASLDRSISQPAQRPTSPITSPSIHKSLTALDAKSITRDMEKSALQLRGGDDVMSPTSPTNTTTQQQQQQNFYFANNTASNISFQSMAAAAAAAPSNFQYHRQNSLSSATLPPAVNHHVNSAQGDAWQTLCVRVLPLFNGEGVQGAIEDLNELLRRCLSESITPKFYRDIEALLRDGMFTLNAKMFGVTDEKLLDRLVEQWSFFFTYALPYFEAVFLPLRTDVRYRSPDEAEMWNVRNMALRSFRDNVILLQTKRLEGIIFTVDINTDINNLYQTRCIQ